MDDQYNRQEEHLIDQLQQMPLHEMDVASVEVLRQRLFDEVDLIWQAATPPENNDNITPSGTPTKGLLWALMLIGLVVVIAVVLIATPDEPSIEAERITTATSTITPGATPVPASLTPTRQASATPVPASATPVPASATPVPASPTPVPASPTPIMSDQSTGDDGALASEIVIEGVVQEIGEGYILIFDMMIETGNIEALIGQINVSTLVRVTGTSRIEDERLIVNAQTLTIIQTSQIAPATQGQSQQVAPPPPPPSGAGRSSRSSRSS